MKTVFLSILGAIAGGAIGAVAGFFAVIAIGTLTGAPNDQGGLAMGAAFVGGPAGLVLGAIAGCVLVLRLRRGATAGSSVSAAQAKINRRNGLIALGLVAAILFGLWRSLFYVPPPPLLKAHRPVLHVELQMPASAVPAPADRQGDLRTLVETYGGDNLYPDGALSERIEGDQITLSAAHTLRYRYADRRLTLYLSPERMVIANLDLAEIPAPTEGFTEWRPVDHLRPHYYGEDAPPEDRAAYVFRYRVDG